MFVCREEYTSLLQTIQKYDPSATRHLISLKQHLKKDVFTEDRVFESILQNPELIKILYQYDMMQNIRLYSSTRISNIDVSFFLKNQSI
jgi:hypothetical protein